MVVEHFTLSIDNLVLERPLYKTYRYQIILFALSLDRVHTHIEVEKYIDRPR